jgi:hypothetical protein
MSNGARDDKGNSGGKGSVFDNLDALRLSPDTIGGSSEVLKVTVRKPKKSEYFRVHQSSNMQLATGVLEDQEERITYFVLPELWEEIAGDWRPVLLVTAITQHQELLLWPVSLPNEVGRQNDWVETAREGCEQAKSQWVRLAPDMKRGAYRIRKAEGNLPEPNWPDKSLTELLNIGFKDRIIDSLDHPVVRRLRGLAG